jgi:hypothetical protein
MKDWPIKAGNKIKFGSKTANPLHQRVFYWDVERILLQRFTIILSSLE